MTDSGRLPVADARRTWAWLRAELRGRWAGSTLAVLMGLIAAGASVVPVYALGTLVDLVREGATGQEFAAVAAVIVAGALIGGLAAGPAAYLVSRVCEQLLADLRESTVARALSLPVTTLERAGRGDLLARVGADAAAIGKAAGEVVPTMISAFLLGVMSLVAMAGLDWRLGLAGAVAVPLYALALRWYLPRAAPKYAAERRAVADSSRLLVESMQGVRTVRAYRLERRRVDGIGGASREVHGITVSVFTLFTRFVGRVNRAEFFGLAAILVTGFLLVRQGTVTVGESAAAAVLFHRLFNPVGMLLFTFDEVQAAAAALARLVGVVDIAPDAEPPEADEPQGSSLELSDVRFGYDDGPEVLHGVSLSVPAGSRVALVGSTGAGKTTLAAIAAGVLTPREGTVRVGGAALPPARLRDHVAIITQEVHVFSGPLIEDLRLARPGATQEEAEAALAAVGALEWAAALPDGLGTAVGEGGHELTTAQAQQLALARLILVDPPVAVLDEATAEAGSLGARTLERSAAAATRGRTTLVVAHRLTQAAAADRVVVLEHGRVVEQGAHGELVAAGGRYAELWRAWEARTPTSTSR